MSYPIVYDTDMKQQAVLENAYKISYDKQYCGKDETGTNINLQKGAFSLPADDPKNMECQAFRFVRLYDGDDEIGLFRIMPHSTSRDQNGITSTYNVEHVLATLLDNVMFGDVQSINESTTVSINTVLGYQKTQRWVLGQCGFDYAFSYNWANEKIYNNLMSIAEPFTESYQWTWDTTSQPWVLNLVIPDSTPSARIRWKHNEEGIKRSVDPTQAVTRLYGLGYGAGVNQLTIEKANPTGLPYIDADTQDQFGIIEDIYVDQSIEDANTLYNTVQARLEQIKVPPVSYTVSAADLHKITNDSIDKFVEGALIQVTDDELGMDLQARVISVSKSDVTGNPGKVSLTIARSPSNLSTTISNLRNRQRIQEVHAQGSTNLVQIAYNDNFDSNHPATINIYVPQETKYINKMFLNYQIMAFRGYAKATKQYSSNTLTSSAGGEYISTVTSAAGGGTTTTTAAGGASTQTSAAGGNHRHIMMFHTSDTPDSSLVKQNYAAYRSDLTAFNVNVEAPLGESQIWTYGASGTHTHNVSLPPHTHGLTLQPHTHNVSLNIPPHTHNVTIPPFTLGIDFGIYEDPNPPTSATIKVDGNVVPNSGVDGTNVDLIPYMAKDSNGDVTRGTWHTISFESDTLGHVVANLVQQIFIQSRGGIKV